MPAIIQAVPLEHMLAGETTSALEPFKRELIRVKALASGEFHHFTHVVNKARRVAQAPTFV